MNLALLSLLLANAGAVRTAMQAVAAPASPAVSEGNLIAALEALLSASKVEEPVRLKDVACLYPINECCLHALEALLQGLVSLLALLRFPTTHSQLC